MTNVRKDKTNFQTFFEIFFHLLVNSLTITKNKIIKKGSEADVQRAIIRFIRHYAPKTLYCATNGGVKLSYMQAARMKLTGYVAGIPDLIIFEPRGQYHGLTIEVKKDKASKPSAVQKEWMDELNKRNYRAVCCHSVDEAIKEIETYLSLV